MADRRKPKSATVPSQRQRQADPARETAFRTMRAVGQGAYANLELPHQLRRARLRGRDAAFATELTYGTLRMQGLYDVIIEFASSRETSELNPAILDVLRLGAHQILDMRVPDHAAVSATVALARQQVGQGAAGLVNAVLRRVSERTRQEWVELVTEPATDKLTSLATQHSHPLWVVRALRAALMSSRDLDSAAVMPELAALLAAHNNPGPLTLTARPGLGSEDGLSLAGATPAEISETAWTLDSGDPGLIPSVRDGRASVQDAGSQLLSLALTAAPIEGRDELWLDMCAGPGGKAGLLAALANQRGATLVANEVSQPRADLVRNTLEAAEKAGARVRFRVGDGRDIGTDEPNTYDRVLVDAPCTGLGALRRRPDARWRRSPADLTELSPLQRELLASALEAVRPGGIVAYATCSPHVVETELVVSDTLKKFEDVQVVDVRPYLRNRGGETMTDLGVGQGAQMWTHLHGTDGMYVALLQKN